MTRTTEIYECDIETGGYIFLYEQEAFLAKDFVDPFFNPITLLITFNMN